MCDHVFQRTNTLISALFSVSPCLPNNRGLKVWTSVRNSSLFIYGLATIRPIEHLAENKLLNHLINGGDVNQKILKRNIQRKGL